MPTLHNNHRKRLPAISLLSLVVAQLASPAPAGIEVEVRGVEEDIRANVLAYLSFERYKESDDLSPEFVERLQERSEREVRLALRPFGYYEPTVTSDVKREGTGSEQDYRVIITVTPGKPVIVEKVEVKVTGTGATDPVFTRITNDLPIQSGDRLSHSNYESLKGGLLRAAATYGYLDARMLRNEMRVDPPGLRREREHRIRDRRALSLRQDHHHPGRHRRAAGAPLPALPGERSVQRHRAAAHAVRARRQPVFLDGRGVARGPRPRESHRPGQHPGGAESQAPRPVRRRLWHRYAGARHGRVGEPAREYARSPLPHGNQGRRAGAVAGCALHRAHRRPGHREVHAAAHRPARAARRRRRPDHRFHAEHHPRARLLVRRALLAARDVRRSC